MVITQTPQQKLIKVANELGLKSLAGMQGTTRMIYDTLEIATDETATATYNVFENVGQRSFPNTNISDNKFQVNEALAVESIGVFALEQIGPVLGLTSIPDAASIPLLSVYVANQRVIKRLPFKVDFAKNSGSSVNKRGAVISLEAPIVIPPQVEFTAVLENVTGVAEGSTLTRYGLNFYGTGVLLNLKNTL